MTPLDAPGYANSAVSEADARDDHSWFMDHPRRRYRARRDAAGRVWVVRRRPEMALLRVRSASEFSTEMQR